MKGKKPGSSRGFFFTALALVILSFMLLSTQVWVRSFEQYDARSAQKFKGEALRLVLSSVSDSTLASFANASAFYATFRLVNFTSYYGNGLAREKSSDPLNNQTGRVEEIAHDLIANGTSEALPGVFIAYSPSDRGAYAFSAWRDNLSAAAAVMGFNASFSGMQNFSFRQDGPWSVRVYFEVEMNLSDMEKTMVQSKRLRANVSFPIDGFTDPFIRRSDAEQRCHAGTPAPSCYDFAERQFFSNPMYSSPSDLRPQLRAECSSGGCEGDGWFFGPVTTDYPSGSMQPDELSGLSQYVLVHAYDENLTKYAGFYGAVVLTGIPGTRNYTYAAPDGCLYNVSEQTSCLNCARTNSTSMPGCTSKADSFNTVAVPYMALGDASWLDAVVPVKRAGLPDRKFVLIDSQYSDAASKALGYHRVWDITPLLDATVCGYYVQGPGPSFFQRMVQGSASLNNPDIGIETFVVGRWAGGADDGAPLNPAHPGYSRLDWEFYSGVAGQDSLVPRIKGMPGCESLQVCGPGANSTGLKVGRFRLSADAAGRYGLANISCTAEQCG